MTMDSACLRARDRAFILAREQKPPDVELAAHLAQCRACGVAMADLDRIIYGAQQIAAEQEGDRLLLSRVEARLADAARRASSKRAGWGRWKWLGAASALAACAIAVIGSQLWQRAPSPAPTPLIARVSAVDGLGRLQAGQGQALALQTGLQVTTGARISLNSGSRVAIETEQLLLAAEASDLLQIHRLDEVALQLQLQDGRLAIDADPSRTHIESIMVSTPLGSVIVTGTILEVRMSAAGMRVAVLRGEVEAKCTDQPSMRVTASQSVLCAADDSKGKLEAISTATETEIRDLLRFSRWAPATSAVPAPAAKRRIKRRRPRVDVPEASAIVEDLPALVQQLLAEGACGAASKILVRIERREAAVANLWARTADCHRAAKAFNDARNACLRAYEIAPQSPAGEACLFDRANILYSLGRLGVAEEEMLAYLAAYPRGTFAAEAHFRLCELAARTEAPKRAVSCLRAFRSQHPGHRRVGESLMLQATLERSVLGDCQSAIEAYRAYLDHGGPRAKLARGWIEWCERQESE